MLGFALDPDFRDNGYIYVLYVVDPVLSSTFRGSNYDPTANEYNAATIGRLTRYTCRPQMAFGQWDPTSRQILIGETKQTGIPICSVSHGVGSLVFVRMDVVGIGRRRSHSLRRRHWWRSKRTVYAPQALADGILRPKEDVGAFRAQLVDSLDGKVLRIDPATGNGLPAILTTTPPNPRAPRSRVWALGLRNPFRMGLRPNTGSHYPPTATPESFTLGRLVGTIGKHWAW